MTVKNLYTIILPVLFAYIFNGCSENPLEAEIVGNKDFVHLERTDSICAGADRTGKQEGNILTRERRKYSI